MKKSTKIIVSIVSFLTIIFIITLCLSYAKYAVEYTWNYYLESKGFYFDSNMLTTKENVDTMWNGKNKSFTVFNYDKENITEFDINYEVTCKVLNDPDAKCFVENEQIYKGVLSSDRGCVNTKDDKDVSTYSKSECEMSGYDFHNTKSSTTLNFSLDKEIDYAQIELSIQSTSPYKKTIKGVYKLNKKPTMDIEYTFSDNILKVKNTGLERCLKISWDSNKARLNYSGTEKVETDSSGYINLLNITIKKDEILQYKFYEVDVNNPLNKDDFIIEASYEC